MVDNDALTYRRYVELGVEERNARAERASIKTSEIDPGMAQGVLFGDGDMILVYEYSAVVEFSWERAYHDGKITDEMLKEYGEVKVIRKLQNRKRGVDESAYEQAKLRLAANAPAIYAAAGELLHVLHDDPEVPDDYAGIQGLKEAMEAAEYALPKPPTPKKGKTTTPDA